MSHYRVTRHHMHPAWWTTCWQTMERSVTLLGYVEADDEREARRVAREEYGSERDIGRIRVTQVATPDDDEAQWLCADEPSTRRRA